jgi:hypothetical protein
LGGLSTSPKLFSSHPLRFLGDFEDHVDTVLALQFGPVGRVGITDDSDDGTVGAGRLMEVEVVIDQVLFNDLKLSLVGIFSHDNQHLTDLSCESARGGVTRQ